MLDVKIRDIPVDVALRARDIVKDINEEKVKTVDCASVALYKWVCEPGSLPLKWVSTHCIPSVIKILIVAPSLQAGTLAAQMMYRSNEEKQKKKDSGTPSLKKKKKNTKKKRKKKVLNKHQDSLEVSEVKRFQ